MLAKRIEEFEDLGSQERDLLGLSASGKKIYVTFRKGHMQVDVRSFVRSREGKKSVENVIRHSPRRADDEPDTPAQ